MTNLSPVEALQREIEQTKLRIAECAPTVINTYEKLLAALELAKADAELQQALEEARMRISPTTDEYESWLTTRGNLRFAVEAARSKLYEVLQR